MQTSVRLRKKFHSAEVNHRRYSGIGNRADFSVCEIGCGANSEQGRKRQDDYECACFPAVTIKPKSNRNIWNDQYEKKPKERRISFRRKHSPCRKQPHDAANDIRDRAEGGAQEINDRNTQRQPCPHEVAECSLYLVRLADQRNSCG